MKRIRPSTVFRCLVALAGLAMMEACQINFYGSLDQTPASTAGTTTETVVLSISPSSVTLATGSVITFSAMGGVPPYAYTIVAGLGSLSGATFTAPGVAGTTTVQVMDAAGGKSQATVTTVSMLHISPTSLDLYTGTTYTFSASGGSPPYTFNVISGGGSFTGATYNAPLAAGTATVQVTDSLSATSSASITISDAPNYLYISPTVAYVLTGNGTVFSAGSGTAPYAFSLTGVGTITGSGSNRTYSAPLSPGTATLTVTDSAAPTGTASASITVYAPFALVPSSVTLYNGSQYTFSTTGGVGSVTYSVASGVGTIDASTGVYSAPSSPATGIVVQAVDSIGDTSTASVTVVPPVTWTIQAPSLGGKPGPFNSLAVNSSGVPQVAFINATGQSTLKFTSNFTSTVTVDATKNVGQYVSLALDSSGNPCVSYYNSAGVLLFDRAAGGTWGTPQTADSGAGVGQYSSIALDSSGLAHISYYDATAKVLKYVYQTGAGSWAAPQIADNGGGDDVGQYSSINLDSSGLAHISYYDNTSHALKYVVQTSPTTWSAPQIVDSSGDVGKYSDSALDSSGLARISYYDAILGHLKYAQQTGSTTWNIVVVDINGNVGQYTSIAVDSSGNPRIAYYDVTNTNLKCAFGQNPAGSAWDLETADTGGTDDVGSYASISLDPSSQKVRITYFDATLAVLKYALQQ